VFNKCQGEFEHYFVINIIVSVMALERDNITCTRKYEGYERSASDHYVSRVNLRSRLWAETKK
jgi:hypothetical protein